MYMNERSLTMEGNVKDLTFRPYWYLGFLALVGVWKLPLIGAYLTQGQGSALVLLNLLWFGWLTQFIPTRRPPQQ